MASTSFSGAGGDLYESQQKPTLRVIILFAILALVAVVLRLLARRVQKLRYEADDYLSVVSLVSLTLIP